MNQRVTTGIVLTRLNYGEADRIIKLLTPDDGKISLMARGVRKPKSKLAGGIELFSVSSLTYIQGRGDLGTLVSARLEHHYPEIIKQIDRVQLGYDIIKILDRATEDQPEADYFELLLQAFTALNDAQTDVAVIRLWFNGQLLRLAGSTPNLHTDADSKPLAKDDIFQFDIDNACFNQQPQGRYNALHIKFLRLVFAAQTPKMLQQVTHVRQLTSDVAEIVQALLLQHVRT